MLHLTGELDAYADPGDQGPHTTGKDCVYLKRVDQVDGARSRKIVDRSFPAAAAG